MFIKKNRKAQSTLEYALIIAVVIAGLITMQTYIKRGLQGRLKQASDDIGEQFSTSSSTYDYTTTTTITSKEKTSSNDLGSVHGGGITTSDTTQNVTRTGTEKIGKYENEYWPD